MSYQARTGSSGVVLTPHFSDEVVQSVVDYEAQPGDVFIVSYPKCGTTWLQHILYSIFTDGVPQDRLDFFLRMPFLERQGAEAAMYCRKPGAFKTHLQFGKNPYSTDAKYIYIIRNPYDCCVSFYYHYKNIAVLKFEKATFDEFFEMFLDGNVVFGDYFDHLMSWYPHRNDPNVLFLTYEGLKKDTKAGIMKIAEFLGDEYSIKFEEDPDALNRVYEETSLNRMKEMVKMLRTPWEEDGSIYENVDPRLLKSLRMVRKFLSTTTTGNVRKGLVGDWRNHLSSDQLRRLKERVMERTKGSDVMKLWEKEDLP